MLPTIAIFLSAASLAVVGVFCAMFLSVAFAGPQAQAVAGRRSWRPPLTGDDPITRWATRMTASVANRHMSTNRSSSTATMLADELFQGAVDAIEQLKGEEGQCSARCHEMIGVTAPEVLAVADSIQQLSATELNRISQLADANAARTETMSRGEYEGAGVTCPLLGGDDTCAVYSRRPLSCRADCAECASEGGADTQRGVSSLAQGIYSGLANALEEGGVDAGRYELNSALASALHATDLSKRWANGEHVFASCKQFPA
ncbi:MAG: YkgJ family cysteine cluster protein [Pirellulaceae bacterium]|nr:YkgJ family cysteine cluster protein [Pirellulaceae bacterium]